MAANKFATMLHNNTNRITLVLIYAVLEWTLIILLLLNSVFSYLIVNFAQFFGLKPPCFWCARIDKFLESDDNNFQYHLCELHSKEVSHMGFCSIHQKLAESHDMCEDCSSSDLGFQKESRNFVFSKVERIDAIQSDEEDEVNLKCSCCRVNFERKIVHDSSCFVIHPLWDILGNAKKVNSVDDHIEKFVDDDQIESLYVEETNKIDGNEEFETEEAEIEVIRDLNAFEQSLIQFDKGEDLNSHDLHSFIDYSGNQLFPFELSDPKTDEIRTDPEEEDHEFGDFQKAQVNSGEIYDSDHQKTEESSKFSEKTVAYHESLIYFGNAQVVDDEKTQSPAIDTEELQERDLDIHSSEIDDSIQQNTEALSKFSEKTFVSHENLIDFGNEQVAIDEQTQLPPINTEELHESDSDIHSSEIDDSVQQKTEASPKFSEKTFVSHENLIDFGNEKVLIDDKTQLPPINTEELHESDSDIDSSETDDSVHHITKNPSTFSVRTRVSYANLIDFGNEHVTIDEQIQTRSMDVEELQESDSDIHSVHEEDDVSIGTEIPVLDACDEIKQEEHSTNSNILHSDLENDSEEEKAPETPSSIHSLNPLHRNWLIPEMKESGAEDSFHGSTMSEPVNTAEKLKSALKAERKALQELYTELEEERNASMVAANETMAMINRLQEEKSAMQMEALQYQRMMEEQSEYDQEALQLLNELMMKKEKELELFRKKVSEYESKEKSRVLRGSTKTGTSSISWSHSEDDDGLSIDLEGNQESQHPNQESQHRNHQNTPIDSVLDLESSLADFEEERVSILEQLKVLEEKLFTLSDEEDRHFANTTVTEDHYEEIGNYGFSEHIVEYTANGIGKIGKQAMVKRLLPLFNVNSTLGEDGVTVRNGYENGFYSTKFEDTAVTRFELEKKRIDMEEEVDQLYGRLQALEADREFLRHCIGSMNKGDKGMKLLQEILYHLRDLRNVNIRAKNYTENALL
ncbi:myosin-binding protein 2 [Lactuca sativa]|uniref:GTD-binding domain-containing protein n=1 Tax=Lactuca sativa TaxID=4236 RepID=A0A9R1VUL0_LACSA|nr:myosin-binding protein 2 [Lactuca sativa]KAJ0212836.1 hypothetical protein LSAT_V11C400160830 [Lactuca sativa]